MPGPWEPFDGARWLREHRAEMERFAERLRDPGREIREMQANMQRQFEELRDPLRGLRESYDQIRRMYGYRARRVEPPRPPLRGIEGGLAAKPRRGRRTGYVAQGTKAAMLAVDFYFELVVFELVVDPPRSVRGIACAAAELATKHGLSGSDSLDPENHAMREAVEARLTARKLAAAAREKGRRMN